MNKKLHSEKSTCTFLMQKRTDLYPLGVEVGVPKQCLKADKNM